MKLIFIKVILFLSLFIFISSLRTYKTTIDGKELIYKSIFLIDEDTLLEEGEMNSFSLNEINILVVDGAKLTLSPGRNITKRIKRTNLRNLLKEEELEEDYSNSDDYKYGLTASIVAIGSGTEIIINEASILVDCPYSNAIVGLDGAIIKIKNSTIITKEKYSKGIVSLHNSFIEISDKTSIVTEGDFSPCLLLEENNRQIIGSSIFLNSLGIGSPLIFTNGNGELDIISAYGISKNSQILIIKGNTKVDLHHCNFNSTLKGINNFYNNDNINLNNGGIVLYRNDENIGGTADLGMYNCNFYINNKDIDNLPMISCYNTEANIIVDNSFFYFPNIFIKSDKIKDSNIYTKITVELKQIEFNGKIIAENNSQIILKADEKIINDKIKIFGNVYIQ